MLKGILLYINTTKILNIPSVSLAIKFSSYNILKKFATGNSENLKIKQNKRYN